MSERIPTIHVVSGDEKTAHYEYDYQRQYDELRQIEVLLSQVLDTLNLLRKEMSTPLRTVTLQGTYDQIDGNQYEIRLVRDEIDRAHGPFYEDEEADG